MNIRLRSFIASALATTLIAFSAASYADDTEIYFARANVDNDENKPAANVLFLIDTSGSMCDPQSGGGSRNCNNSTTPMVALRSAFSAMVNGLDEGVRIGLAKFNGGYDTSGYGGYVFYPVSELDDSKKSEIIGIVNNLQGTSNTPTMEAYSEAARYMLGMSPTDYARRGEAVTNTPRLATNVTSISQQCSGSSWNQTCYNYATGSHPNYETPINMNNQCESNHIIVMTDGAPTQDADYSSVNNIAGGSCSTTSGFDGSNDERRSFACQRDLAAYLQEDSPKGKKPIQTWQIAFGVGSDSNEVKNMRKVAVAGGTKDVYYADDADSLAKTFIDILDLIDGESRSISAPGIAVNTMNRFQHLDELYYAVFQPAESSYWEGNLKSYRLAGQEIRGQNGNAIDPSTGYFSSDAQSYWSSEVDGADAQKGGAREQVTTRNLFYSTAGGTTHKLNWSSGRNQAPTNAYFGLSTNSNPGDADRTAMFTRLQSMWGDPMHSVPLMVNYGGEQNYVFVSTNGGMLHIIDTSDGSEAAAFMPHELFEKAPQFTTHRPPLRLDNTRQLYGLDASWIAWRKPGETVTDAPTAVYLYGGMRRGGKHFYALDVSSPSSPSLKWQIDAGDAGFERLGQTWSTPTLTRIPTGEDSSVPALVFGGGYSPDDHDNHANRQGSDAMGNTVYIVNAESGDLIWSATHANMNWAIPGGVSVVDTDLDGVADHLYFADLGGQVFRTDLQSDGNHSVHRIAELGGNGTDHRRFYEAPAVAYVKHGAENHLYVAVASGYRAHPLDEATNEGLFVVVDKDALGTSTSTLASIANMANVANNQEMDPDTHRGWYYLFQEDIARPGEKALASPSIFDNTILLSTYAPTVDQDFDNPCAVRYGAAYLHTVNLRTGAPRSLSKDAPDPANRSEELSQTTPPPTPTIMVDEDGNTVIVVGTEIIDGGDPQNQDLRKRRWMQLPKNEALEILQPPEDEG